MRAPHLLLLLALASGPVLAQNSNQNASQGAPDKREALSEPEQKDGRRNQRTERIQLEDAGSRVDELRVGGQTQSITVQPNAPVPSYEVQPADSQGVTRLPSQGPGSTGPRRAGRRM